ncbi:TatD family hydrolase [Candidatus Daviesbacteria bacterium]|nr:TatD family hydrolase [Candidatus Daviesbacteria bacterium]
MLFDTHSHIQFKIFNSIRNRVIKDSSRVGVNKIIAVGTNLETSKKAVEVAKIYPEVFASVGIHPHHVFDHFHSQIDIRNHLIEIEGLLGKEKVVAIGETGMDKYEYPKTKYKNYQIHEDFIALQKELFELQIKLAIKYQKALIIHNRKAVKETLEILNKNWDRSLEGHAVFHMCEPDERLLSFAIKNKVFISFGGDITYNQKRQNFLKQVPLELLVLETDSPFCVPQPLKSKKSSLNTPANLKIIAEKVAEILKADPKEIEKITFENGKKLFGIIS